MKKCPKHQTKLVKAPFFGTSKDRWVCMEPGCDYSEVSKDSPKPGQDSRPKKKPKVDSN